MIRRSMAAAALAMASAVIAVLPAAPAQARACSTGWECYTDWYSDPARTNLVGGMHEDCYGHVEIWGVRSGYRSFFQRPCNES